MNEMMILDKPVRQVNGLYCLNDLHRASGGLNKNRPSFWLQNHQTIDFIKHLEAVGNPTGKGNQQVIKSVNGIGTYGNRKVALAYATWISPEFFSLVLDTFDAVAMGNFQAAAVKPHRIDDLPPSYLFPQETHLPRPPRNLAEARALFTQIDEQEARIHADFRDILAQRAQMCEILRKTQAWREYWLAVEASE